MKTPQTFTVILSAGQAKDLPVHGTHVHVRSSTVGSFRAAFDSDPFETFYAGATYPSPRMFRKIRFFDYLGGGCTIVVVVTQAPFSDVAYDQSLLSAIETTLNAIEVDMAALELLNEIPDTPTVKVETTIPQTGVGEEQMITGATENRKVLIQTPFVNAGLVYLGFVTGVTAANTPIALNPGDSWHEDFAGDVFACSQNGTEVARGYVLAIA